MIFSFLFFLQSCRFFFLCCRCRTKSDAAAAAVADAAAIAATAAAAVAAAAADDIDESKESIAQKTCDLYIRPAMDGIKTLDWQLTAAN